MPFPICLSFICILLVALPIVRAFHDGRVFRMISLTLICKIPFHNLRAYFIHIQRTRISPQRFRSIRYPHDTKANSFNRGKKLPIIYEPVNRTNDSLSNWVRCIWILMSKFIKRLLFTLSISLPLFLPLSVNVSIANETHLVAARLEKSCAQY